MAPQDQTRLDFLRPPAYWPIAPDWATGLTDLERFKRTCGGDVEVSWEPELDRIQRVIVKNARGHVLYEMGEPMLARPSHVSVRPIQGMTARQIDQFENVPHGSGWPEVGSRMMQRAFIVHRPADSQEVYFDSWQDVQDGVYRYAVAQGQEGILVRMVLREYLACEVGWE